MKVDEKLVIEEDGVVKGVASVLNFTGAEVAVVDGKITVTITGGGGGGSGYGYFPQGWS